MQPSNIKKFFNNFISISRQEKVRDDYGGVEAKWNKIDWHIPCRIYSVTGSYFTISFQGKEYAITRKMMCEARVDIEEGDRVMEENFNESFLVVRVYPMETLKRVNHLECLLAMMDAE